MADFAPSERSTVKSDCKPKILTEGIKTLKKLEAEANSLIRDLSPARMEKIQITLGRSDSIAKFFAFSFVFQPKRKLSDLKEQPFFGSGIYAIYYHGKDEPAYSLISNSETPIYVGKADPKVSRHENGRNRPVTA